MHAEGRRDVETEPLTQTTQSGQASGERGRVWLVRDDVRVPAQELAACGDAAVQVQAPRICPGVEGQRLHGNAQLHAPSIVVDRARGIPDAVPAVDERRVVLDQRVRA